MRPLKVDVKCKVAHVCKKMTLGTEEQIRTEGREYSLWRTVESTGILSASVSTL